MNRKAKQLLGTEEQTKTSQSGLGNDWIDQEVATCHFGDVRLDKRFRTLLEQLAEGVGESIPCACQDWANIKAAYRFLSHEGVEEEQILSGHFECTRKRAPAGPALLLLVHDTTEFSYQREDAEAVGLVGKAWKRNDKQGQPIVFTTCGICMHSSLAVTTEGLPLGLAAVKFWGRKTFKGEKQRKKERKAPIEQKESFRWLENLRAATLRLGEPERWVHIGDQESDIYELLGTALELHTHFLVRTRADRLADGGPETVAEKVGQSRCRGRYRISVRDKRGAWSEAELEVRYRRVQIDSPRGKKKLYPAMVVTIIEACERETPAHRERIDWILVTDLPVHSLQEALEKIQWYSLRWKIELFHKILKSGCKAEESRLRTEARLAKLLAVFCILSWRIFWLTMINRCAPDLPPALVFTPLEIRTLDQLVKDRPNTDPRNRPVSLYLKKLAQLGGYLARNNDPPPGNLVIWRGLRRLVDIELGVRIGLKLMGNS